MQIKDVMTENVSYVSPAMLVTEVARLMRDQDIGAVPVAENDRLIGMITDRDIVVRCIAAGKDVSSASAREVMSPHILYCMEDQSLEEVLQNMGEQQVRRLPVLNRQKRLVGVVSLGDLSARANAARAGDALKQISKHTVH